MTQPNPTFSEPHRRPARRGRDSRSAGIGRCRVDCRPSRVLRRPVSFPPAGDEARCGCARISIAPCRHVLGVECDASYLRVPVFCGAGERRGHGLQSDVCTRLGSRRRSCDRRRERAARVLPRGAQSRGCRPGAAMLSLQGVKMGRPSHVHMSIGLEQGRSRAFESEGNRFLQGKVAVYLGFKMMCSLLTARHHCEEQKKEWNMRFCSTMITAMALGAMAGTAGKTARLRARVSARPSCGRPHR